MKKEIYAVLGYAIAIMAFIILVAVVFKLVSLLLSNVLLGFGIAVVFWIFRSLRGEPIGKWYIVRWGIFMTIVLIVIDLLKGIIIWFGTFFWIALIGGFIVWIIMKSKKKS